MVSMSCLTYQGLCAALDVQREPFGTNAALSGSLVWFDPGAAPDLSWRTSIPAVLRIVVFWHPQLISHHIDYRSFHPLLIPGHFSFSCNTLRLIDLCMYCISLVLPPLRHQRASFQGLVTVLASWLSHLTHISHSRELDDAPHLYTVVPPGCTRPFCLGCIVRKGTWYSVLLGPKPARNDGSHLKIIFLTATVWWNTFLLRVSRAAIEHLTDPVRQIGTNWTLIIYTSPHSSFSTCDEAISQLYNKLYCMRAMGSWKCQW